MALSGNTVWEVRTAGSDTNGGGFVTGATGSDMSQFNNKNTSGGSSCFSTTADLSTTDAVAIGTTTITSATANFSTNIVGNIVYFAGGTGSITGVWRQVTARASTTSITIDVLIAASTGMTMNIGGALASPGQVGASWVSPNIIYIKSGTYSITSASTNISGGCFSTASVGFAEGYGSTRGDLGTKPILQASGISTFILFAMNGARSCVRNITFDGASLTSSKGLSIRGTAFMCKGMNCTNTGLSGTASSNFVLCETTGCSTAAPILLTDGGCTDCSSHDNTITGFASIAGSYFVRCLAYNNTGASSDGFAGGTGTDNTFTNCISYGNGRDGFRPADTSQVYTNCIAEGNAGYGFNLQANNGMQMINCAGYNNTSGNKNATGKGNLDISFKALTTSPFTNAASANFALNNTSGGGADLRAAAVPGVLAVGGTSYLDIGALQHQDTGGGGTSYTGFFIQ